MKCRIDITDRMNRLLIGLILIIGSIFSYTREIMIVVGAIQLFEGALGFCALSCLILKSKLKSS